MHMLDHFGWQSQFVVYLAGHNRPSCSQKPRRWNRPSRTSRWHDPQGGLAGHTRAGANAPASRTNLAVVCRAPGNPADVRAGRTGMETDADTSPARIAGVQVEADELGKN